MLLKEITTLESPYVAQPIAAKSPRLHSRSLSSDIEIARREGDDRFRFVLDLAQVAVWAWSAALDTLEWSGPVEELLGTAAHDLNSYAAFRERIHSEDRGRCQSMWSKAVASGQPLAVEFRFWDASRQEYRWYQWRAVPGRDTTGSAAQWFGTCTDIHELQTADAQLAEREGLLRKREQQLSMLFETGTMGDWTWDIGKDEIRAHRTVWAIYGAPDKDDSEPVSWFYCRVHLQDRERLEREVQLLLKNNQPIDTEFRVIRPDHSVRWVSVRAVLVRDSYGEPLQAHGLTLDITDRKVAEQQVEESERQLREQADAMRHIAWTSKADGSVDYYNHRWYEYSGHPRAEIRDWFSESFLHPDDAEGCVETSTRGFANGTAFEVECRLKRASDRSYRWHAIRCFPYRDQYGRLLRWFGTGTDIHEQKTENERLEAEVQTRTEQLRRSLTEIETLLKEVHHRVKNNLQVISSLLWMQSETLEDPCAAAALRESQQRVFSMALIHERLYGSRHMDEVDFADYAQTLITELFYSYAGSAGHVSSCLSLKPVSLKIDQAIPCGLILNELVTNALKYAYPEGSQGEIAVGLEMDASGEVTLTVSDNGIGLPEAFNWKESKTLGLPIVDLLAKQIGGKLTVRDKPGAGFTVTFPKEEVSSLRSAFVS